ncbi:MAG TPA: neutral/alkaline non-lysosomal ceramidase N-terminal domain-containing protein [Candidatus Solibacter sp.]|nr:neutral/alkaline non-lysosomal ceramidase N-terminal domain-containing protein [Candidatus Solibacter sp.]
MLLCVAAAVLVAGGALPRSATAASFGGFPADPAGGDGYRDPGASAGRLPAHPPAPGLLEVGVGRADITPPTGYYLMGWERSDSKGMGVHTRLYARAIVLAEGGHKVAFVVEDLNGVAGGVLQDALTLVGDPALNERTVLVSATHTHAGPSGYWNFSAYNTVFPTLGTLTAQNVSGARDDQLYSFEVRQLAAAIRAADADLAPGAAAWAHRDLVGLTMNRSLEAHLANFGIHEGYGTGNVDQDPGGYLDTIDPAVDVLRVDKLVGGRDVPIGVWSSFANHGTVDKATYTVYNGDHQASADRAVESAIRAAGAVPSAQEVVSAFANADEGDQTSGIRHSGPADAERVGDVEAHVLLDAWTEAGKTLSTDLPLDMRWTRISLSGVSTSAGHTVGTDPVTGLSLFTGSEEGRGPLYDITGQVNGTNFEGVKAPVDNPVDGQGDKVEVRTALPSMSTAFPHVLPITVLRLGDRLVATIPGEMTVAMAKRVRAAVLQAASALPIHRIVIDGLTNEYMQYFTTPEEYEAQHYEGGSTIWGEYQSYAVLDGLVGLAGDLAGGRASAAPADDDARNGVTTGSGATAFPTGATSATITSQPATTERLARSVLSWQGAALGADMPVGRAFVTVQRLEHGSWTPVADDLGLQIVWRVDDSGKYTADWEVPLDIPTGEYEMVVTANHYSLTSAPFTVVPSTRLVLAGTNAQLHVGYPAAVENVDVTARPVSVAGGTISGRPFSGGTITASAVPAGAVQDAYGNCNGSAFGETGSVSVCPEMDVLGVSTGAGSNGAAEALPNTAAAPPGGPAGLLAGAAVGVVAGLSRGGRRRRARPRLR